MHKRTFRGAFVVQPGILNFRTDSEGTEDPVFLNKTLVSYNWTVVPTQIQDTYKIVLEPTFDGFPLHGLVAARSRARRSALCSVAVSLSRAGAA